MHTLMDCVLVQISIMSCLVDFFHRMRHHILLKENQQVYVLYTFKMEYMAKFNDISPAKQFLLLFSRVCFIYRAEICQKKLQYDVIMIIL